MDDRRRLDDLARRAARTGQAQFTRFLEPAAERDATAAARDAGVEIAFFGGHADAERRVCAFYSEDPPEEWPVEALALCWNARFSAPGHRDLLGAAMALGLERDAMGDICMGAEAGTAYLFCLSDVAGYICASFESAGRTPLTVGPADEVRIAPPEGTRFRATVSALRLDAVLAAGFRLSRAEAQRLIRAGSVKLDHSQELRTDAHVGEGSLLSARGFGRLRVDEVQGETRKGRTGVVLFRFGK